jgi:hypothetical protein
MSVTLPPDTLISERVALVYRIPGWTEWAQVSGSYFHVNDVLIDVLEAWSKYCDKIEAGLYSASDVVLADSGQFMGVDGYPYCIYEKGEWVPC